VASRILTGSAAGWVTGQPAALLTEALNQALDIAREELAAASGPDLDAAGAVASVSGC
jgi:hypothetical protein